MHDVTVAQVEAQRNAYLSAHYAAKDALQKRLAFLARNLAPQSREADLEAAALLVTTEFIGESGKIRLPSALAAIVDQLHAEALTSDEIREIAANAAHQRGLAHMINAYDIEAGTNDANQVAIARRYVGAALEVGRQKAIYLCSLAQLALQVGEGEEGYRNAEAALREEPSNGEALRLKGMCAWALGRHSEAEGLLADSLRVAPYLDGAREALAMVLNERAEQEGLNLKTLRSDHGFSDLDNAGRILAPEEVVRRLNAIDGPASPDPDLYAAVVHHQIAIRLTPHGHAVVAFDHEKKGLLGFGKGPIRAHGIANDGSPFFLRSAQSWSIFGGFLGEQLFAQLTVPPPSSGSRRVDNVLDTAIDFTVTMRSHLFMP